jgi:probable F420-dependent oxidoreductase
VRPFRFLAEPGDVADPRALVEAAREAESIGYDVMVYPDHVVLPFGLVPLLSTVAAVTTRLRVAAFVINNDLRHPAIVAQDMASIDVLSGGRVEVAIGAGWNVPEYEALGIPFDAIGTRVRRLTEAVTVIKGCFGDAPFSFAGEFYAITNHDGLPKPVQKPRPPLFIGGGGRRLLTLAGREADIVGVAPRTLPTAPGADVIRSDPRSITVAATEEKLAWVREAAGDRFRDLEINAYPSGTEPILTDHARKDGQDVLDGIRHRTGIEITLDEFLESPHVFIGSVDGLVAKLQEQRERLGITSIMTGAYRTLAPVVERLAAT